VHWEAIDAHSAQATLTDGDVALTMLFRFNAEGLIDTVRAESRGRAVNNRKMTYAPWQCRLSNYAVRDGIRVPLEGQVPWLLPEWCETYFHGTISSIAFEFAQWRVAAGSPLHTAPTQTLL